MLDELAWVQLKGKSGSDFGRMRDCRIGLEANRVLSAYTLSSFDGQKEGRNVELSVGQNAEKEHAEPKHPHERMKFHGLIKYENEKSITKLFY